MSHQEQALRGRELQKYRLWRFESKSFPETALLALTNRFYGTEIERKKEIMTDTNVTEKEDSPLKRGCLTGI